MLLITITGLIVPATAASGASYNGFYGFNLIFHNGKEVKNKVTIVAGIDFVKTNNKKEGYYSSSKKKLKAKLNKVSKIVLMIKKNGKYKRIKVFKKPKKGWKLIYYPQYKYKNGKLIKTGKYAAEIRKEFKYKEYLNIGVKGSLYAYNSNGKLLYKKTNFELTYY
jgi:hypothetical protein